jgi:hypothetical protein
MTKSYVVDPSTGKILTVREYESKGGNTTDIEMIAIVPDDGSPAFAMPVETFGKGKWRKAMQIAESYKAPHHIEGSDGTFTLPSRKQAIDIRAARESGLEQLLDSILADELLYELRNCWGWTREAYIPAGTSEEDWESKQNSSGAAWSSDYYGMSNLLGFSDYQFSVRPVTLLKL